MSVAGTFTQSGGTFTHNSGTLKFNGSSAQSLECGSTLFNHITLANSSGFTFSDSCTLAGTLTNATAGSQTTFTAGSTYNINRLNLEGSSGNGITLSSSVSGSVWLLEVTSSTSTISYITVSDSDASTGEKISAGRTNTNGGNNFNWQFASPNVGAGAGGGGGFSGIPYNPGQINQSQTVPPTVEQAPESAPTESAATPPAESAPEVTPETLAKTSTPSQNQTQEQQISQTLTNRISSAITLAVEKLQAIVSFILNGTPDTQKLGLGERAGSVYRFNSAFNKLPQTEEDWNDVARISTGQTPVQRSESRENQAKQSFQTIYLREPNPDNQQDQQALLMMAYGIRPQARDLGRERIAIGYFIDIYHKLPKSTADWDMVRAIGYSGAKR